MPKGHRGQTCAEAMRASIGTSEVVSASELSRRVKKLGSWKDETISQHLMSLVVNLPPARDHWKSTLPFFLLRPDGQYALYDHRTHPKTVS
jgi:hypothetical protein